MKQRVPLIEMTDYKSDKPNHCHVAPFNGSRLKSSICKAKGQYFLYHCKFIAQRNIMDNTLSLRDNEKHKC